MKTDNGVTLDKLLPTIQCVLCKKEIVIPLGGNLQNYAYSDRQSRNIKHYCSWSCLQKARQEPRKRKNTWTGERLKTVRDDRIKRTKQMLDLKADGMKIKDAAESIGVSRSVASVWLKRWRKEEVQI